MQSIEGFDEHDLYPVHESETPPPSPARYWQVHYLTGALHARLADGWIMSGSCLHYLEEGQCVCVTPDLAVVSGPPSTPLPGGYTAWEDPPLLFAAEVEEDLPVARMAGEEVPSYVEVLRIPEFLHVDPPARRIWLLRRSDGQYQSGPPDEHGRLRSEELSLSFGFDERGFLRVYTAYGEVLLTHEELVQQAQSEAQRRADAERRLAELTAELERLRRSGAAPK